MTEEMNNGAGGPVVERNLLVKDVVDRLCESLGTQMNEKDVEVAELKAQVDAMVRESNELKAQVDAMGRERDEERRRQSEERAQRRSLQPGYQSRGAAGAAALVAFEPPFNAHAGGLLGAAQAPALAHAGGLLGAAQAPALASLSPDAPDASILKHLHGVNTGSTPAQISTALAAGNLLRAQKRQADDASRPERTKENKRLKKLETVNEQIMKATTEKTNCENMKAQLEAMPTNSTVTKQIGEVTKQIAFWEAKLSDYESYKRGLEAQAPISGSSNGGSSNSTPRSR